MLDMKNINRIIICLFLLIVLLLGGCNKNEPITYNSKYILIDGISKKVEESESLYEVLYRLYGENLYEEKEGFEFKGWFKDKECNEEVEDLYINIENGYELYSKYIHYFIPIDKLLKYGSKADIAGDIVVISPSYQGKINELDLDKYKKFVVTYDTKELNYIVINEDELRVPFDGFLVLVNEESDKFLEYSEAFEMGTTIYINSYVIDKSSIIVFERPKQDVELLEVSGLSCSYASLYDVYNDVTLFSKDGDKKAYPASTTKIITALTALKYCPLDTVYTIGGELSVMNEGPSPSTAGLRKGQKWTLWQLLFAMLLPSGNDAAYSIAALTTDYLEPNNTYSSREKIDKFASLMNQTAKYVGATNSHFMVPDGNSYYTSSGDWDNRLTYHYVTANDMVKFARYAFNCAAISHVVSTTSITFQIVSGETYSLSNTNSLIKKGGSYYVDGAIGMKTGTTNPAGYCLVSGVYHEGNYLIAAVMKSTTSAGRYTDSRKIYNAYFNK